MILRIFSTSGCRNSTSTRRDMTSIAKDKNRETKTWFYTCLAPQGDFANRFLEQPLIKTRLIHWLNFKYGATGYLHWGFNQWFTGNDPYKETTRMNEEGGNTLPGGDSWIVYPNNGKLYGPSVWKLCATVLPTIRF